MKSPYFKEEHHLFRETVRDFFQKEVMPHVSEWENNRRVPKDIWKKMGDMGYLGLCHKEEYGGIDADIWYSVVFLEELAKTNGGFSSNVSVHIYMATNHIAKAGSEHLKQKYLVPAIAGEMVAALAVSEPGAGSDVSAIRTHARREGDHFIVNGQKLWITNGTYCDYYTAAVKTDNGITLMVIEGNAEGVTRNKLNKMGLHSSDTAEVYFDNVKVPVENVIGEEGKGFYYIMDSFQLERLVIGMSSIGANELALQQTLQYMAERETFGRPINKYQVLRHTIAQLASEVEQNKQFVYHTCWLHEQGEYVVKECSMIKLLSAELNKRVVDECLQMFGGYGYVEDFPICQAYRDVRVGTIAGGTSQIMREIISKIVVDGIEHKRAYKAGEEASNSNIQHKSIVAKEIVKSLSERFRPEKAADYTTTVHYDISGENGGKYTIKIANGACQVEEGLQGEAKCIISVADKLYEALETGKADPQAAFMNGEIKVSDVGEMMNFTRVFKKLI